MIHLLPPFKWGPLIKEQQTGRLRLLDHKLTSRDAPFHAQGRLLVTHSRTHTCKGTNAHKKQQEQGKSGSDKPDQSHYICSVQGVPLSHTGYTQTRNVYSRGGKCFYAFERNTISFTHLFTPWTGRVFYLYAFIRVQRL